MYMILILSVVLYRKLDCKITHTKEATEIVAKYLQNKTSLSFFSFIIVKLNLQ